MSPWNKRTKLKIILLGDSGVGKTSLAKRYPLYKPYFKLIRTMVWLLLNLSITLFDTLTCDPRYNDKDFKELHLSTVSIEFLNKDLCIENKPVSLQIVDTAGQERFNSVTHWFYRDTNCCVLVYDVNILETFKSLDNWHAEFIKVANPITPDKFPFVLMGNKTDVKGGESRVVKKEKAVEWCNSKGEITYFETSAKENINVDEAFLEIARKALSNLRRNNEIYPPTPSVDTIEPVEVQARRCAC